MLVLLQVPFLSPGAQMAEGVKVGYPEYSDSNSKLSLGYLPGFLGWRRKISAQASSCLIMNPRKHPKPKGVFLRVMFCQHGTRSDSLLSFDRIFPAAGMLSASVLLSRSGRQTTAGRVKRWLPVLCSKTVISSCFPTTCQKWFIGTGMGQTGGRHQWWSQSLLPICAALFPNSLDKLCSAGGGQSLLMCVWLFCAPQKGDDCQNVASMGVCQLSLGYTLEYSMFKQWRVVCGNRKVYFCYNRTDSGVLLNLSTNSILWLSVDF